MKSLLLAAVAALALAQAARAETLEFPSDAPVVSVTFPDDWKTDETETGAQSFSADDAISLYADVATGESVEKVIGEAVDFLQTNGVTIDGASEKRSDGNLNGLPATSVAWKGEDADGAVDVQLMAVVLSETDVVVFTYWASEGAAETHSAELDAITNSVKPVSN